MDVVVRVGVFLLGLLVVYAVLRSAVVTFILTREGRSLITRQLFLATRKIFNSIVRRLPGYAERDRVMALYAPISLLLLVVAWLMLSLLGFSAMFWATGTEDLDTAYRLGMSSLFTLGFASAENFGQTIIIFMAAATGLLLIAVLIGYLPTIYAAFSKRETLVTLLEVRAGNPPFAADLFERFYRIHGFEKLNDMWRQWEVWFAELDETHTSLAVLPFYRSPRPGHSWIVAAGAVLDSAALANSTVDIEHDPQADLCLRAGYLALRHIADFFQIAYNANPAKGDPISITREEFDAVYDRLFKYGIPMKENRQKAWEDFAGWRVNYDTVLRRLAVLAMAPEAPWISDEKRMPKRATVTPQMFGKWAGDK